MCFDQIAHYLSKNVTNCLYDTDDPVSSELLCNVDDFNLTIDSPVSDNHDNNEDINYLFSIDTNIFVDDVQIPNCAEYESPYNNVKEIRFKYPRNVMISHINVNSLRNKFDELRYMLDNGYLDILCVSETKLDSADAISLFNVKGFTTFRQDKRKNSGGLMIFINERIACRQITMDLEIQSPYIELITIELILDDSDKWLLCYLYKNPKVTDNDFEAFFSILSDKMASLYDNYMCIGDLNMNFLNPKCRIHDLCSIHGLYNIIKSPTCWKGSIGTLIDLFLVPSTDKRRFCKGYSVDIGVSDFHSLVLAPMRKTLPAKQEEHIYYRKVKNINYEQVRLDLFNLDLIGKAQSYNNANEAFSTIHNALTSLFDKHAPLLKRKTDKNSFPVMNTALKKAIIYRNRLQNKLYKTRLNSYYVC